MPYLGLEHVESGTGRILIEADGGLASATKSNNFRFKSNHVLYGKLRPYLNKVALPEFAGRCTTEIIPLQPVGVNRQWLAWLLRRQDTVDYAMKGKTGSRMPRASMRDLMEMPVLLPPLDEQLRIVGQLEAQLDAAKRAQQAAQAQLDALEALPAALLREIFPRSPSARLPRGWRWVKLGEICQVNPRRPRDLGLSSDDDVTFIPMAAVSEDSAEVIGPQVRPFREVKRGYTYIEEGDLIFAKITPCMQNGKHAIVRETQSGVAFGSTEFHVLRPTRRIDVRLLHRFLLQPWFLHEAQRNFRGAVGQQRLPKEFLSDFPFPLPPVDQQDWIARQIEVRLSAVDQARAAAKAEIEAAQSSPSALLRLAFPA